MTRLPVPEPGGAVAWVERHLAGLYSGGPGASDRFRGGQPAAEAALAAFDVAGYAARRNQVFPETARGASALSPYIRHGLLQLPRVWEAVGGGPERDVAKFRDELLWQEYARHLYARLGPATARPLRHHIPATNATEPWPPDMACIAANVAELEGDGWLVNQARMWLASQWTVRHGADWRRGEDRFFTHLLDGSRAANRLGWQWTAGQLTGRAYGFSRRQVETRAPQLCADCALSNTCPIEEWPPQPPLPAVDPDPRLAADPDAESTAGPRAVICNDAPDVVWLTAESLGDADPALQAHPDAPALFVFDAPLLARLQLAAKRLVFLAECLAATARQRTVVIHRGRPTQVLARYRPAVTFTPVPGWRRISGHVELAEIHPWPWLRRPHAGPVSSFSAWRKRLGSGRT